MVGYKCVPMSTTMANTDLESDGHAQLPRHPASFSSDMDVQSVPFFLGDNGIPSDVCEIFEGYLCSYKFYAGAAFGKKRLKDGLLITGMVSDIILCRPVT